ncbi:unnamed protein product [Oikopleura dioica]|uniref:Uncharacterized protein n=1 Tax=Oikopleura dioica TaxID=34765 RepID=E4X2G8_OIKDI|nr:unnamed protein product [Oikopleura dioica]
MNIVNRFKRAVVKNALDTVIYFAGVANLVIICFAYGYGEWIRGTTSNDLSSSPMIEGDCIDANGGNHCNVNIGLFHYWKMETGGTQAKSYHAPIKNCEAGGDFYVRIALSGMRAGQKAPRNEPLLCEKSNCTGFGNEICVRVAVTMNALELTWIWIGIAIGLSLCIVVIPFMKISNYTVRWIIVGYMDIFNCILQLMRGEEMLNILFILVLSLGRG